MKQIYCYRLFWFIIVSIISNKIFSQAALPDFSVNNAGKNKVIVSWTNFFPNLVQLSVQRSYDSLRNFQTVFSAQSPQLPGNGYADNNISPSVKYYYRIFYVFDDGRYYFTKSKSSIKNSENVAGNKLPDNKRIIITRTDTSLNIIKSNVDNNIQKEKFFYIYDRHKDSLLFAFDTVYFSRFKDSIINKTKDTLQFLNEQDVLLKPYISPIWKPSIFLFTNEKGSLKINLPSVKIHKYKIKILEETGIELFEIKNITENMLYLEKGNFFHAGWFWFELYEDDKLKEKNKFYLEKDF